MTDVCLLLLYLPIRDLPVLLFRHYGLHALISLQDAKTLA